MILWKLFTRRITSNRGEHLDADTLASFSEHALSGRRRTIVFTHLSECEACRELIAAYSALRDFDWGTSAGKARKTRAFRSTPAGFFQVRVATAIACALLLFAAISPRLFIRAPARPASMRLSGLSIAKHPIANQPKPPVVASVVSRASREDQPQRRHVANAPPPPIVLWRRAWFQPVVLTASRFEAPRPRLPGPLRRARLARNLNFAANFSIEEAMLPSLNQVAVQTTLGERWITLDRFSEAAWLRF